MASNQIFLAYIFYFTPCPLFISMNVLLETILSLKLSILLFKLKIDIDIYSAKSNARLVNSEQIFVSIHEGQYTVQFFLIIFFHSLLRQMHNKKGGRTTLNRFPTFPYLTINLDFLCTFVLMIVFDHHQARSNKVHHFGYHLNHRVDDVSHGHWHRYIDFEFDLILQSLNLF